MREWIWLQCNIQTWKSEALYQSQGHVFFFLQLGLFRNAFKTSPSAVRHWLWKAPLMSCRNWPFHQSVFWIEIFHFISLNGRCCPSGWKSCITHCFTDSSDGLIWAISSTFITKALTIEIILVIVETVYLIWQLKINDSAQPSKINGIQGVNL